MFVLYSRVNLMINQGNHNNIRGYMDNLDENMSSSFSYIQTLVSKLFLKHENLAKITKLT